MNKFLGASICFFLRRHRFGKAHFEHFGGGVYSVSGERFKTCKRCKLTVPVKTRAKRG